jgi:hypothetical protein
MGSLKPADYELEVVLVMVVSGVSDLASDADNAFVVFKFHGCCVISLHSNI